MCHGCALWSVENCNAVFSSSKPIQTFLQQSDKTDSGDVGLAEFIHYVREHEKNLRLQFSHLDKNRDGMMAHDPIYSERDSVPWFHAYVVQVALTWRSWYRRSWIWALKWTARKQRSCWRGMYTVLPKRFIIIRYGRFFVEWTKMAAWTSAMANGEIFCYLLRPLIYLAWSSSGGTQLWVQVMTSALFNDPSTLIGNDKASTKNSTCQVE